MKCQKPLPKGAVFLLLHRLVHSFSLLFNPVLKIISFFCTVYSKSLYLSANSDRNPEQLHYPGLRKQDFF
jgi:hypothetical protein